MAIEIDGNINITIKGSISGASELTGTVSGEREIKLQDKTVTPDASVQVVTADEGYDGLGAVTVEAAPAGGGANLVLSSNVDNIPYRFFENCTTLEGIEHQYRFQTLTVNSKAFQGCTGLKTVKIPYCADLKGSCFDGCTAMEDYWFGYNTDDNNAVVPLHTTLNGVPNFKIHVPAAALEMYQNDMYWSMYYDHLVGDYVL